MNFALMGWAVGVALLVLTTVLLVIKLWARLRLSRAKHPSLRGHARIGRWVAGLIPFYEYGEEELFRSDGAPDEIAARRREGFFRLADLYRTRFAATARLTTEVEGSISDVQFTAAYRVPFQYARFVRRHLPSGSFL